MDDRVALSALDAALRALREDAAFAEAEHGRVHAESLLHYVDELTPFAYQAYEEWARGGDLSMKRRDREGLRNHAIDIAKHVYTDVETIRGRHRLLIVRQAPSGPGARAQFESALSRGLVQLDVWWEGRIRLGPLRTTAIAARDWRTYRPGPRWAPWLAGSSILAAGLLPFTPMLF